jgi:transcriptional regulator with XRE-family HTH domain
MAFSSIGERLQHLRELAGLDRADLSTLAHLAPPHVGMIERGDVKSPSGNTVAALAEVLGVSTDYLLRGSGIEPDAEAVRVAVEKTRSERSAAETRQAS